jgi:RimJ/RimL family protein N-acetyltransferase
MFFFSSQGRLIMNNLLRGWAGKLKAHSRAGALLRRLQTSDLRELCNAVAPVTINDLLFMGEESANVVPHSLPLNLSIKHFSETYLSGVNRIDERLTPQRLAYVVFCGSEIVHESWVHLNALMPSQYGFDSGLPVIGQCFTKRPYRGNGIYPYALTYILKDLKNRHITDRAYTLVSRTNNASIRGIEKAGFQRLAHLKGTRLLGLYIANKSVERWPEAV